MIAKNYTHPLFDGQYRLHGENATRANVIGFFQHVHMRTGGWNYTSNGNKAVSHVTVTQNISLFSEEPHTMKMLPTAWFGPISLCSPMAAIHTGVFASKSTRSLPERWTYPRGSFTKSTSSKCSHNLDRNKVFCVLFPIFNPI